MLIIRSTSTVLGRILPMTPYSWMAPSKTAGYTKYKDGELTSTLTGVKFPPRTLDYSPDPVWRGAHVAIPPEEWKVTLPDWINPVGASEGRGRRAAIGAGLGGVLGAGLGGLTGLFKETFLIPAAQETDYVRSILRGATFGGLGGAGLGALAGSTLGAKNLEDLTVEQLEALRDNIASSIGHAVEEAQKNLTVTGNLGPLDLNVRLGKSEENTKDSSMRNDYSILRQHLVEKVAFLGGLLGSQSVEPDAIELPSVPNFDEGEEKDRLKALKALGYKDIRSHSYTPYTDPYTAMGSDGKYHSIDYNEDTHRWEARSIEDQYGVSTPDELPDPYNRSGPGLVRGKESSLEAKLLKWAASPAWTRAEGKNPAGGLNARGRASYKAQTGGTLRPPVSKERAEKSPTDAKRRASFCARSDGQRRMHNIDCSADPEKRICKARTKWDC
jgi:hypothetical protein